MEVRHSERVAGLVSAAFWIAGSDSASDPLHAFWVTGGTDPTGDRE
jgi:hypothetical protein